MRKMTTSFFGRSQYNDWKIILAVFFGGLALSTLGGVFIYFSFNQTDSSDENVVVVNAKKVDRKVLTDMISKIEDKQKKSEELKLSKPIVSDPSL